MRYRPLPIDFEDVNGPEALEIAMQSPGPGAPCDPDALEADALADLLAQHGADLHTVPALVSALLPFLHELATKRAGEALRTILRSLGPGAAAVALERAILGADGESIRAAAERAGSSPAAIQKQEGKLRKLARLFRVYTRP